MADSEEKDKRIFFKATTGEHAEWKGSVPRLGTTLDALSRDAFVYYYEMRGATAVEKKANAELARSLLEIYHRYEDVRPRLDSLLAKLEEEEEDATRSHRRGGHRQGAG